MRHAPAAGAKAFGAMSQAPPMDERWALPMLSGSLLLGLIARLIFAFHDDGLWWPDEYYQSLEPAHRAVFGYGWEAWEFLDGARHWTLPGLVAGVMKLSNLLHLDYLRTVEVAFCLAGVATAWASYRLARALDASPLAAAAGASAFSLMGLAVYAAPRAMGETLSALPITLAFALLLRPSGQARVVGAGALLSLAVGLRLQNGLFCLGALWLLWAARRRTEALVLLRVLLVGTLVYGAVDQLTWGAPFHSASQYLRFNLLEGRSSSFGTHPVYHYLRTLVTAEGMTMIPLVILGALGARTRSAIGLIALGFCVVHSLIPHKELRFLFPVFPLLTAQAAVGLDALKERKRAGTLALLALSLGSLVSLPTLTFWRLGISDPDGALSAIDYSGPENRLLLRARALTDLCGLKVMSTENWRTGGYAYLHRAVPMYRARPPEAGEGHFNYVIARRGEGGPGTEVAVEGEVALFRLPGGCTADQSYDWHLE